MFYIIREILRLLITTKLSNRNIGRISGKPHSTIRRYRKIVEKANLRWEDIQLLDDDAIEKLLRNLAVRVHKKREPDFAYIHDQLQIRHVTLQTLWEEYALANPLDAYSYSQFTHRYRRYVRKLNITMRQIRRAGERMWVDYAGTPISWTDRKSGDVHQAQIFASALGCSGLAFAYATRSQTVWDFIEAHNEALKFYGGSPKIVTPDNLKAAVTAAGRVPVINRTYWEFARHYDMAIDPARVRHPKDKAPVELNVLLISRCLARLRHRQFFSLEEINDAIRQLLPLINDRPFKRMPDQSRRSRFEMMDKPLLRKLPAHMYEYAEWTGAQKVGLDYHVPVKDHFYSVPYTLVHESVEARVTGKTVELFHKSRRIASHVRSFERGGHSTIAAHQPPNHRYYAEYGPNQYTEWAKTVGMSALAVVQHQLNSKVHTIVGLRACSTLQRLAKDYGPERFEAACRRAEAIGSLTVTSIRSILRRGLTDVPAVESNAQIDLPLHNNIRGATFYAQGGR